MTQYESPEAAYQAFFTTFNAEDPEAWAGVMNYPHVRVSSRATVRLYPTAEDYANWASWDRFKEAGWVRTEGIEPVRTHESADKVHLAGGWSRYNAAGAVILSNRVSYVLTRIDDSWGIQARFGVDSLDGGVEGKPTGPSAEAATDLVERYLDAWDERHLAECARYCAYPVIQVDIGDVQELADASALEGALSARRWSRSTSRDVRPTQIGLTGVNVAVAVENEFGQEHGLFLVANRDGRWSIIGRSIIAG